MKCSEVHNELIFYAEGSLEKGKSIAVQEHLRKCSTCNSDIELIKASLNIIEEEKKVDEDVFFAGQIIEKMKPAAKYPDNTVFMFLKYAAAAAVVILGIFTGVNIARLTTGGTARTSGLYYDEAYYMNDMDQEPIESFFLLKFEENE